MTLMMDTSKGSHPAGLGLVSGRVACLTAPKGRKFLRKSVGSVVRNVAIPNVVEIEVHTVLAEGEGRG